jgi:tetratricopeptide (TPR) repeat protein
MENAIEHALELDPLLGEAYAAQGQVFQWNDQSQEAERVYQLAIELSPNYATAYHWYSLLLARQPARMGEALALNQKARELDPLSPVIRTTTAWIYNFLGEFERAEQLYLEVIELNPNFPGAANALSELYADSMGRFDKAARLAINTKATDSGSMWILFNEFRRLSDVGATKLADKVFQRMEDLDRDHIFVTIAGAFNNIGKGNFDAAIEYANSLTAPDQPPGTQWTGGIVRFFTKDYDGARQAMLRSYPGYYDPQQWPSLFEEGRDDACIMAWVFMHTGDQSLGRDLATDTIVYLEETLPQYIKHADRNSGVACHAVLGDKESMLRSLEIQVSHNHIGNLSVFRRSPTLESILDDPRFIALEQQVSEELERQRIVIEAMYSEQSAGL